MFRSALIALAIVATLTLGIAPAFAGAAESAFLQSLVSTWSGKGTVSGPDGGPISCRLVIKGSSKKVTYSGRCTVPDMASQTFTGSITYNDAKHRYEARSRGGTVIGVERGNSVVFSGKNSSLQGTVYSTMTFSARAIVIEFSLTDRKGQKTNSEVHFSR